MSFFFSPQALFGGYPQHPGSVALPFAHPFAQHVATPSPFGLCAHPVQHLGHLERGRRHGRSKRAQCDVFPCSSQQRGEESRQPTVEGRFQVVQQLPDGSIVIRPYPSRADELRKQERLELERKQRQEEAEHAAAIAHAKAVCEDRCKLRQREYEEFIRELQFAGQRKQQQQEEEQQQTRAEDAKKQSGEDKPHDHESSPREFEKAQVRELLQHLFGSFFGIQFEDDEEQARPAVEQAKASTDVTADAQATTHVVDQEQHVDSEDDEAEFFVDPFASLFGFPSTRPRRRHPKVKRAQRAEQTPKDEQAEQLRQQQESIETTTTPSQTPLQAQSVLQEDKVQPTATTTTTTTTTTTVGDVEDETPASDQDDQDNTNDTAYDPYDINSPLIVDVAVQPAQPETKPEAQAEQAQSEQQEPAPTIKEAPTTTTPQTPALQTSSQQLLTRLLAQNEKLFTKRSALFNKVKLLQNQSTTLSTQEQTQLATLQQHLEQVDALIAQSQTYTDQLLAELHY